MGRPLTHDEASQKASLAGCEIVGEWMGMSHRVSLRCLRHGETHEYATPQNILYGKSLMTCCWRERNAAVRLGVPSRKKMKQSKVAEIFDEAGFDLIGEYDGYDVPVLARCRRHDKTRTVMPKTIFHGGGMMCCWSEKISSANKANMISKHTSDFEYCANKARKGLGKRSRGMFYIAKIGDLLKFGGTTIKLGYRIKLLEYQHGNAKLVMSALADDVHEYEASMMERHREHWVHGEFFRNFLYV